MAGDADDGSNPFLNRRRKLEQDADDLVIKLASDEEKERLRLQKELQEHLDQAKSILLEDIDIALSIIPPLLIKKAGSTSFDSEAFAWFYDKEKPLVLDGDGILASGSHDRTIRLWNAHTGEHLRTLKGHIAYVASVAFSPGGKILASGSYDNTIRLWNTHTGEHLRTLEGHLGSVRSVAFSSDGKTLASGCEERRIRLWNAHTGKHLRTLEGHKKAVYSVSFSPDGKSLASISEDRTIRLWNAHTGESLRTLKGHLGAVMSVAFSPDGKTLASGSEDKTIRFWNTHTGKCLRTLGNPPRALGINPNPRTLLGHEETVYTVAFSPDGNYLASGSGDKTIRLWNAHTGKHLKTLEGHIGYVASVAFFPAGNYIASGSGDKTIRLWNTHTGEHLRTLEGHEGHSFSIAIPSDWSGLEVFTNKHLGAIYSHMCHLVAEADFKLSTKDGIEFTITWHGTKA